MVDTQYLEKKMLHSGLKKKYLAKELGISTHTLMNKVKNKTEFKVGEIEKLASILEIKDGDAILKIFFTQNVDK